MKKWSWIISTLDEAGHSKTKHQTRWVFRWIRYLAVWFSDAHCILLLKAKISAQPVAALDLNFCYNLLFIFWSTQFRTFLVQLFELFVELISSAQLSPPEQAKWLPNVSLGADQPVAWLYLIDFLCSKSKGFLGQEQRRTILIINKNYYVRKNRKN